MDSDEKVRMCVRNIGVELNIISGHSLRSYHFTEKNTPISDGLQSRSHYAIFSTLRVLEIRMQNGAGTCNYPDVLWLLQSLQHLYHWQLDPVKKIVLVLKSIA